MHRHVAWIFVSHWCIFLLGIYSLQFFNNSFSTCKNYYFIFYIFIAHQRKKDKTPPPPPVPFLSPLPKKRFRVQKRNNDHSRLFLQWLKISYFIAYSRFSCFVFQSFFCLFFLLLLLFFFFFSMKTNLLLAEKRWKWKKCPAANKCLPKMIAYSQGP